MRSTSVQLAEIASSEPFPGLPTRPEPEALGCARGSPVFSGRPGGLAVRSDGAVLLSLPSTRAVWRVDRGWAHSVSEINVVEARDGVGRSLVAPTGLSTGPDGTLYAADGVGMEVGLRWPAGIAIGHGGELWVADYGNRAVRRIERNGATTTALRFEGRRWPVCPALTPEGELIVAIEVISGKTRPLSRLISIQAAR
ncbi:MAG: NHL repeat-containing protein [Acidimicrobiales bacterium]